MNFWYYLIVGAKDILSAVLSWLPDSTINPVLSNLAVIAYYGIAPILFFVGPFISLTTFGTVIGLILASEITRAIIAVWRLILKVIPALN
jgi:hypothetical protein